MDKKQPLKILRVAVDNVAGFPYDFRTMHNACGDISRLVTLHRNALGYPEDICLDLPLPTGPLARLWRKKKEKDLYKKRSEDNKTESGVVSEREKKAQSHYFKPKNFAEKVYFMLEYHRRKGIVNRAIKEHRLDDFEIIFYDSGVDFYRNSAQAKRWKAAGKKIILCYYGSDLRIRGVIKEMEELADISITAEYDHLDLKPDLEFIYYPYDSSELPPRKEKKDDICRIVHSPTNRLFKGTDLIIEVIEQLKKVRKFEFILLENMPRREVLEIKSGCDVGIGCIGSYLGITGYGKSALEMLALGIPVVTTMPDEYRKWLPENPFAVANNRDELYDNLLELIDNPGLVSKKGDASKAWVEKYHGFANVNRLLYDLFKKYGVI